MRYLTVALTKGRLADKTLEMFEQIGITCEEMRDKKSRKLIFSNDELGLRFFQDFLAGDRYFKVRQPGQNLNRARVQFRLCEAIEARERSIRGILERL